MYDNTIVLFSGEKMYDTMKSDNLNLFSRSQSQTICMYHIYPVMEFSVHFDGGKCPGTNRFFGTFVISNLHPVNVPTQAPTSPTLHPTTVQILSYSTPSYLYTL